MGDPGWGDGGAAARPAVEEQVPPHSINLLELPTEMLLLILERLLRRDPVTLATVVPAVCRRLRGLCDGVHGAFDFGSDPPRTPRAAARQMLAVTWLFPRTAGLWTIAAASGIRPLASPLHFACAADLPAVAARLMRERPGSEAEAVEMTLPIVEAARFGAVGGVRVLLDAGINPDAAAEGDTALCVAGDLGHVEVVRLLVERGADVDKVGSRRLPALALAAEGGHLEVVSLLLEYGADVELGAPLYNACMRGVDPAVVRLLVDVGGADVRRRAIFGWTPVYAAGWAGAAPLVRLLVERGAEVDAADERGRTALMAASQKGHLAAVQALVECGACADIDGRQRSGR